MPFWLPLDVFTSDNGPQAMLIQLLPSSTVAAGVRLKIGFGTVASEMPGGTWYPHGTACPVGDVHTASGGMREPLQYWRSTVGLPLELCRVAPPYPVAAEMSVRNEYCGASVTPELCPVGAVSPRTPISQ